MYTVKKTMRMRVKNQETERGKNCVLGSQTLM